MWQKETVEIGLKLLKSDSTLSLLKGGKNYERICKK